jgi:hypothetical protein
MAKKSYMSRKRGQTKHKLSKKGSFKKTTKKTSHKKRSAKLRSPSKTIRSIFPVKYYIF